MIRPWEQRPQQLRDLFNPAFCAAILCEGVREFAKEQSPPLGLPFVMSYLLLPMSLHAETRKALPRSTITPFTNWVGHHPEILIGLRDRVAGFREITSEAIRYGIAGGILDMLNTGHLVHVPYRPTGLSVARSASDEVEKCFKAVRDLSRWFRRVPDATFLFHTLRIRP